MVARAEDVKRLFMRHLVKRQNKLPYYAGV